MPVPDPEKRPARKPEASRGKGRPQPRSGGAPRSAVPRADRGAQRRGESAEEQRAPKQWGSVGRKGTRQLKQEGAGAASLAWREAVARSRGEQGQAGAPPAWEPEVWVRERPEGVSRRSRPAKRAGQPDAPAKATPPEKRGRPPRRLPAAVSAELSDGVGPTKVARLQQRLTDAAGAFERDRYRDAARMLKPLAEQAPGVASVRELYGLTLYRLGRWNDAIKEFEAFRALTGSCDQHPALADCYRAKKRWRKVDELWEELRRASPGQELVAEGRIVAAGSLAERGRTGDAIALLESGRPAVRKPKAHHLRTWYALADLYERAGEVNRARELFRRVLSHDADLFDTAERLAGIG